jgi:hypothetical protein
MAGTFGAPRRIAERDRLDQRDEGGLETFGTSNFGSRWSNHDYL